MSEPTHKELEALYPLAINRDMVRFEPPVNASAWRVRRVEKKWEGFRVVTVRTKHVCDWPVAVPLVLALNASVAALTRAVEGTVGMYRLDPIDDRGRVLGWQAGYAIMPPTERDRGRKSSNPDSKTYPFESFPSCDEQALAELVR